MRKQRGRWVIVFHEHVPPVLWSLDRDALKAVCRRLRETCLNARVAWQPDPRADDTTNVDKVINDAPV